MAMNTEKSFEKFIDKIYVQMEDSKKRKKEELSKIKGGLNIEADEEFFNFDENNSVFNQFKETPMEPPRDTIFYIKPKFEVVKE